MGMKYRVQLDQDEDGVFVAEVPALPGCISQGKTRAKALANIKEAVAGYLKSLKKHNEPVPRAHFGSKGCQSSAKVRL
jgi:predicted RNase H-like HicB family nuclease